MTQEDVFLYNGLTPYDQIIFAKAFQISLQLLEKEQCWCLKKNTHAIFQGFTTSKTNRLLYKNQDARPLILAMANKFATEEKTIIVRRSVCSSKHCLNPNHYYWGTRADVAYESTKKGNKGINKKLITKLREENKTMRTQVKHMN